MLDFDKLRQVPATPEPFPHLVAAKLLDKDTLQKIDKSFPDVPGPGSFPTETLDYDDTFAQLLDQLTSPQLAEILEEKLQTTLSSFPTMITVRGHCRESDGKIHADSMGKIATVLLYLNSDWSGEQGGRLRLLNGPDDLEDSFAEIPPEGGTLLAFRCDRNAWHGHAPYAGPRRTLQLNWVSSPSWLKRERLRHRLSSAAKKFRRWLSPGRKPAPATARN